MVNTCSACGGAHAARGRALGDQIVAGMHARTPKPEIGG